MNILLVNDDGYQSEALAALREKLKKYGHVTTLAPNQAMSGKSVALTIYHPFHLFSHGEDIYSIDGTPADCVSLGLTSLNKKFDLVVSGINYGLNITYDTMHSGTCGACMEAIMYDTPAIAFSMEYNHDIMIEHIDEAMQYILKNDLLSSSYFLNVNFPFGKIVKGIKFTNLCKRKDKRYFINDDGTIYPKRDIDDGQYDENSDVYAVNNGYISVCPMKDTVFSSTLYKEIKTNKKL